LLLLLLPLVPPQKYRLVPEEGFLVGDSDDLDFVLVAVAPVSENGAALSTWGHLELDGRPGKVSEGEFITIIQV
jgi:endonuclease G